MTRCNFWLRDVTDRTQLASNLGVPVRAIDLVELEESTCKVAECNLLAAKTNKNQCPLCCQDWYPKEYKADGITKSKYARGHGLYGKQYMRLYGNKKSPPATCCCNSALCEKIGYSHEGMFRVPSDEGQCRNFVAALGVNAENRRRIFENGQAMFVAPWHFHPRHREKDEATSISDPVETAVTKILHQIPYGFAVEVDKGFLIENQCAPLGIVCIRPMKLLEKQQQQSKADVALTQKVGKTRIAIEQANGQMKAKTPFFDGKIHIHQLVLADLIFRASYLMTNFCLPFIQERDDVKSPEGRPCNAEIRYYDASDEGLVDVRPMIELWGNTMEIARWRELRADKFKEKLSDTEISELVLEEDWPTKLLKEHKKKCKGD